MPWGAGWGAEELQGAFPRHGADAAAAPHSPVSEVVSVPPSCSQGEWKACREHTAGRSLAPGSLRRLQAVAEGMSRLLQPGTASG